MSLRDYLLTRMALRQNERSQALELEQTKAARQAAEQAAYAAYGNQAIQGLAKLTGVAGDVVSGMEERQAAEMADALKTRALAQSLEEQAGVEAGVGAGGIEPQLPMPLGSYKAPDFKLMLGPETSTAAAPATPPAVIAPAASGRPIGGPGQDGTWPSADPETEAAARELFTDGSSPPASASASVATEAPELTYSIKKLLEGTKAAPAGTAAPSMVTRRAEPAAATPLVEMPDFTGAAKPTGSAAAEGSSIFETEGFDPLRKIKKQQAAQTAAVQGAPAVQALEQTAAAAAPVQIPPGTVLAPTTPEVQRVQPPPPGEFKGPEVSVGSIPTLPVPGLAGVSIPDPQAILTRTTPAEDAAVAKAASDDLDKQIADLKLRTGVDIRKPAVAKSIEAAGKITGYTPPVYSLTARELAKKVTDEVYAKRPPNNPLTALFMRDASPLQRSVAEDKAFLLIQSARKEHGAQHLDAFIKKEELASKLAIDERKMSLLEAQALLAQSKSDKLEVTIKKPLSRADRQDLQTGRDAVDKLEELKASTSTLLQRKDKPGQLPIGPLRAFKNALAQKAGINIGTVTSQEIDAKLGVTGVGAGGKVTTTTGGRIIDTKAFDAAFEAMDSALMSDEEKRWYNDYRQAIQIVGKELEGGKLTDADLQNYKKILFASDNPSAFIDSLNQLGNRTGKRYSNTRDLLSMNFNLGDIYPEYAWSPIDYSGRITESAPPTAAMALPIPSQGANLAGQAMDIIQKAMQPGASSEDLAAAEAALKRMREQSAGAGPVEGDPALNPLN